VEYRDLSAGLIKDIQNHERLYDTYPELCWLDGQITKGLAELWIEMQAVVDLADCSENLLAQTDLARMQNQFAQCLSNMS
jgi:hypothetical protein